MSERSRRAFAGQIGGLLLAVVLMALAFYKTDFSEVRAALGRASLLGLALVPCLNLAHNCVRAWRWRTLLEPVRPNLPFWSLLSSIILGYAASIVLPGRLGEVVRPATLAMKERIPLSASLGSVLADRLLDLVAAFALFVFGLSAVGLQGLDVPYAGRITLAFVILIVVLTVVVGVISLIGSSNVSHKGARQTIGALGRRVRGVLSGLAMGFEALRSRGHLPFLALQSLAAWGFVAAGVWVGLAACQIRISAAQTLILLPILIVGFAVPTPAGAGGYHASMTFGLTQLFGVDKSDAFAASILIHLFITLPVVLMGAGVLAIDPIKWKDVRDFSNNARSKSSE